MALSLLIQSLWTPKSSARTGIFSNRNGNPRLQSRIFVAEVQGPRRCVSCTTTPISDQSLSSNSTAQMDATLFRDNRLALDWLGSGKFAIAFYVQKAEEAEEKGLSVQQFKQLLKEGV